MLRSALPVPFDAPSTVTPHRRSIRIMDAPLLRLIHLGSVSRLEIANIHDFPINAFFPCVNLVDLTLFRVTGSAVGIHDHEQGQGEEAFVPEAAPQLRSFAFNSGSGPHVLHLLNDRRSDGTPVIDFGSVRRLSVKAENERDLVVIQVLIRATQKLEVVEYTGTHARALDPSY